MMRVLTLIVTLAGQCVAPIALTANAESRRDPFGSLPGPTAVETGQHSAHCPGTIAPKPPLTIWTSRDCASCRQFWRDFNSDRAFREAILSRFRLQWRDVGNDRSTVAARGIVSAPTFRLGDRQIVGYHGRQWLWRQLTTVAADAPVTSLPTKSTTSSPTNTADAESGDRAPAGSLSPLPPLARRTSPQPSGKSPSAGSDAPPIRSAPTPSTPPLTTSTPLAPARLSLTPTAPSTTAPSQRQSQRERLSVHSGIGQTVPGTHRSRFGRWIRQTVPFVLTGLQLAGILGGTAATGGLGTIAVAAMWRLWKRRRLRKQSTSESSATQENERQAETEASGTTLRAPFPRRLDEARQLLALRQSEGRVATLDALRGMFLDDELAKLAAAANQTETALAQQLKSAIDTRVDEVAPLSTVID